MTSESRSRTISEVRLNNNTAEWLVVHPEGAQIRKDHSISAEIVQKVKQGTKLILKNAGGGFQDGFLWGQISGGEFNGRWVAVQKKDPSEDFLIKQP
jgi:hypothetical protein